MTLDGHTFTVVAGGAICVALFVIIFISLFNLAAPELARRYLERAGGGYRWEDLTATERRVLFTSLVLGGFPPRLFGLSLTLAFLGAHELTYQPQRVRRGKHRGGRRRPRRRLVLAHAENLDTYGNINGSIELFVEGPTISGTSCERFRFGVRRRLHERTTRLEFHDDAHMALLDYYESVRPATSTNRDGSPGDRRGAA